jgi:hypothetical protein
MITNKARFYNKKMLTLAKFFVTKILSNDLHGGCRPVSGIFYRQNSRKGNAPVSAYREVCGDLPCRVVDNTGAFSMSKKSRQNLHGGSI